MDSFTVTPFRGRAVDWPFDEAFASHTAAPATGAAVASVKKEGQPAPARRRARPGPRCVSGPVVLSYAYLLCIAGPMASPDGPDLLSYALVTNIGETAKTKYRRRVDERAIYGPFL